jgi:hypothetical protein
MGTEYVDGVHQASLALERPLLVLQSYWMQTTTSINIKAS